MWGIVGRQAIWRLRLKPTIERMFLGQYKYTTDAKGRLTIPVHYREDLAAGAYVIQGFERNLMVYTAESFEGMARKASTLTSTDPEARAVRRVIFGGATEVSLDSNGRVLLLPFLREYAGIDGEAYIVGAGHYFEIWRAEDWEQELGAVTDPEANARRFADFDLSTG